MIFIVYQKPPLFRAGVLGSLNYFR